MNRNLLFLLALSLLFVLPACDNDVEGDEAGECSDGVDNDQDGTLDCGDDGCAIATACTGDNDDAADDDDAVADDDDAVDDDDSAVADDDDAVDDDDATDDDDDDDAAGDDDDAVDDDDDDSATGDDDDAVDDDDDDSATGDDDSAADDDDDDSAAGGDFVLILTWTNFDDLDIHLLRPEPLWTNGGARSDDDCYYANTNPDWGVVGDSSDDPALVRDDITGLGPETIVLDQFAGPPHEGWYQVMVHDYPGTTYPDTNDATLEIWLDGVLTQSLAFQMPAGEDSDFYVAQVDSETGQIQACSGLAGCP